MFKTILMPTDYSAGADHALRYAAALAKAFGARLTALHVIPMLVPSLEAAQPWPPDEATVGREKDRLAAHVRATMGSEGTPACDVQVVWGGAFDRILDFARELPSDLIVMGTHGRTGLRHLLLGSVTERVVRYAPCPVFAVRHPDHAAAVPPAAPSRPAARPADPAVAEIMKADPLTIGQHEPLSRAEEIMRREGIHQLLVVDGGALIGILAERDLHAHSGYYERTKVDAAMTSSPLTIGPADSASRAAAVLIEKGFNALPVVDDQGGILGVVSRTDILRLAVKVLAGAAA